MSTTPTKQPLPISSRFRFSMQTKLVAIFLLVKVIPLIILCFIAWRQFVKIGEELQVAAVTDSAASLNATAVKNIERMTTDAAGRVAEFLYRRDADIRYLASVEPNEDNLAAYIDNARGRVIRKGQWDLAADRASWVRKDPPATPPAGVSSNVENEDMEAFHPIPAVPFQYDSIPLYDEIAYLDLEGNEIIKVVSKDSPKRRFRMNPEKRNVSRRENTYVKAETYWQKLRQMQPGEIFVSDVVGAYVGANFIGMYTPETVAAASKARGYPINYAPEEQAYAGQENPNGRRFEGIVRWATPIAGPDGRTKGYVTFALNHDHIMEFVDHITPMDERYTEIPSAFEGNYAFIWDYTCRSIAHPRHHSITGFNPETGDPEVPWLEESLYNSWKQSGNPKWFDYLKDYPVFFEQSRSKRPAPDLTRMGLVGLDGRYLNNAPQCIGWMDLTATGGSGSLYILWSGIYKLNTAAAIPYYTGQYAPSAENGFSRRGFGFVAIGSGLESFTNPAREMGARLGGTIDDLLRSTITDLIVTTLILTAIVVLIAIWMAWNISAPIKRMAKHMAFLSTGEKVSETVDVKDQSRTDELGMLARSLEGLTQARIDEYEMINAIASGDYTRQMPLRSLNDILARSLNSMVNINKNALSQVNDAVVQVDIGAASISDASLSLSKGAETSQNVLHGISQSVNEVERQVNENVDHARGANHLAIDSRDAARRGYDAVNELSTAMAAIQQSGAKIASVVKLIDDIAFQTNLLALNAAVEAARAGRQGKGFSVVADEVRNLASRSAKAAHETSDMVASMLESMESGMKLAARSDSEFREIVDIATKVAHLFETIERASEEQSNAVGHIVTSLGQIDEVIQDNSNNAEQLSTSASELSRQAEELREMVSYFRLGPTSRLIRKSLPNSGKP